MSATCGPHLDDCRCYSTTPRTPAQIAAAHREAVNRARRSGFAAQPLPKWVYELLDPTACLLARLNRERAA